MKTTKFFSVLSLALIFAGVTAGFTTKHETPQSKALPGIGIKYQVIIHSGLSAKPCNTYLIQVVDETGRLVAPPQTFVPGVNRYFFNEKFSATGSPVSRRAAMLVPVKDHYAPCSSPIFAIPDVKAGPFWSGQTYFFNLFLKTQSFTLD
jgi:hypothetical protein